MIIFALHDLSPVVRETLDVSSNVTSAQPVLMLKQILAESEKNAVIKALELTGIIGRQQLKCWGSTAPNCTRK